MPKKTLREECKVDSFINSYKWAKFNVRNSRDTRYNPEGGFNVTLKTVGAARRALSVISISW